jgi:hypothetical protein
LFSLPSFAAFREIKTWPSSWEPQPVRLGEPGSAIFNLPADPGYRALGREVRLYFNLPGNIRHQMQVTYEYETADGSTGYGSTSDSNSEVSIQAMLQEAEIARLKGLFEKLARLDAAGSDVDKLQQLRMNWAAWN